MGDLPEPVRPSRRPRLIAVGAGLAAVGLITVLWIVHASVTARKGPTPETLPLHDAAPPVGRAAPDFTLPLFSGGTLRLHSLKGSPVVLNFWASWCVPCRAETPLFVRLHQRYGPRGVMFVGIDVEDDERDARRFIGQYHVDYPVVRAPDETVMVAYAIQGIPSTVFIGADGIVAGKFTGAFLGPEGEKAIVMRLDRLLKAIPR